MYTYVSATLKARGKNQRYQAVDISLMLMKDIFSRYLDGYIRFTNSSISGSIFVDLNTLRSSTTLPLRPNMSFTNWLGTLGNRTIPALLAEPTFENTTVVYSDAKRAVYDVKRVHPTFSPTVETPLATRTDLQVRKTGVNPTDFYQHVLVSVNGLFHLTDSYSTMTRVKDGGRSVEICNNNQVGLLSFKHIGAITSHPITEPMIVRPSETIPHKQSVWIDTGLDLTNKSVILSLGGYLHINDLVYDVISLNPGIIKVNFDKVQLMHRIMESRRVIDLSALELSVGSNNDQLVGLDELYSDAVLKRYLQLRQSFFVVVDTPSLYTDTQLLQKSPGIPGLYISPSEPVYPMRLRFGNFAEYWPRKEDDVWTLSVADNAARNYLFETTRWQSNPTADSTVVANDPFDISHAHLVEIGSQVRIG
jgi:hypothetical protein